MKEQTGTQESPRVSETNGKGWVWSESVSKEVKAPAPTPVTPSRKLFRREEN